MEGGPPSFRRDSTCPAVLTHPRRATSPSPTGLSPAPVARSSSVRLGSWLFTLCRPCRTGPWAVQPQDDIGRQTTQSPRFGLLPFRSPLLRESSLFLEVLRCFSSPGSPRPPMCSATGARVSPRAGCPIRTPSDHSSPAAPRGVSPPGHVLLRPQTPRHPPCALHADLTSVASMPVRRKRFRPADQHGARNQGSTVHQGARLVQMLHTPFDHALNA